MSQPEGPLVLVAPQVRDTPEPFVSRVRAALSGRTRELERLAVELYARGLSAPSSGPPNDGAASASPSSSSVRSLLSEKNSTTNITGQSRRWPGRNLSWCTISEDAFLARELRLLLGSPIALIIGLRGRVGPTPLGQSPGEPTTTLLNEARCSTSQRSRQASSIGSSRRQARR